MGVMSSCNSHAAHSYVGILYNIGCFALTQTYEFLVSHSTLQLKMKILGNGQGYSLREFCTETNDFVEVAETCNSPPYSLTLSQIHDIIEARSRASEEVC